MGFDSPNLDNSNDVVLSVQISTPIEGGRFEFNLLI